LQLVFGHPGPDFLIDKKQMFEQDTLVLKSDIVIKTNTVMLTDNFLFGYNEYEQ